MRSQKACVISPLRNPSITKIQTVVASLLANLKHEIIMVDVAYDSDKLREEIIAQTSIKNASGRMFL